MATVSGSASSWLKYRSTHSPPCLQRSPRLGHPTPKLGRTCEQHSTHNHVRRGRRLNAADTSTPADSLCRVLRVTYLRPDGRATGWGLHVWGAGAVQETAWDAPMPATGYVNIHKLHYPSSSLIQPIGALLRCCTPGRAIGIFCGLGERELRSIWSLTLNMMSEVQAGK